MSKRFNIMEILIKSCGLFLVVFLFQWNALLMGKVEGVSVEEDLRLSPDEKQVLDKFKRRVIPILPHKYMKEDIYLIRWLRARNFNVNLAEQMLKNNLRWRREQRMDTIHQEDWSDMKAEFPYYNDKFDKEGRPLGAVSFGPWNFRKMAISGKMPRLQRYLNKLLEEIVGRVIEEQYKGNNVTQCKVILNMEGFNQIQHACPLCLPAYTSFVANYEEHYPGYADQVIHINSKFSCMLHIISEAYIISVS